jgi:hypothetical protein
VDPDGRAARGINLGLQLGRGLQAVAITVGIAIANTVDAVYSMVTQDKAAEKSQSVTGVVAANKNDSPDIGLRAGGNTLNNYTPSIKDAKTGLSLTPPNAPQLGTKQQMINLNMLPSFNVVRDSPTHISLTPKNLALLDGWIATKGTTATHPLSVEIQNARVGEVRSGVTNEVPKE